MRILYSDNGTLADITKDVSDYKSGSFSFTYTTGQDFIYIGSDLPLNHLYFKLGASVNNNPAAANVEIWNGKEWVEVVHVMDETSAMAQSGFIEFVPDKDESWDQESTNYKGEQITGLSSVVIYDLYWARISFDATLDAVDLAWVGNLFSDDNDLYGEFPVFNSSTLKTAFETGKTTWEEQHVRAAEILIRDLKKKQIIKDGAQILDREDYRLPAASKAAQIIFTAMGDDYVDNVGSAKAEYDSRLEASIHKIDRDADGILDEEEKFTRSGYLTR
jgi:hypothetical protein